jgi:phosphoserine aminotransferase
MKQKKYCTVNIAASSEEAHFTYAPALDKWTIDPDTAYVHYTPNETIGGVEFQLGARYHANQRRQSRHSIGSRYVF